MRRDSRSEEAQAWRHLYKSSGWRKGRVIFLQQHPLCERCEAQKRTVAATVVNHRKPHKGDVALFFDWNNWSSLCKNCHDGAVQSEERTGVLKGSINGRPRDPDHPWNKPAR